MIKNKVFYSFAYSGVMLLTPGVVAAQEVEDAATFSAVPFIFLVVVLFVFRKKLIAEATPEHVHGYEQQPATTAAKVSAPAAVTKHGSAKAVSADKIVDLTKGASQCQGATAKGSRCSRTANLETLEAKVRGKKYRFMSCKQHNNNAFAPFSDLIS